MNPDYPNLCEVLLPSHPVNSETIGKVKLLLPFFRAHLDLPACPQIAELLIGHCDEIGLLLTHVNLESIYRLHRREIDKAVDKVPTREWRSYIEALNAAEKPPHPEETTGQSYGGSHGRRVPVDDSRTYSELELDSMTSAQYAERVLGVRKLNGQ